MPSLRAVDTGIGVHFITLPACTQGVDGNAAAVERGTINLLTLSHQRLSIGCTSVHLSRIGKQARKFRIYNYKEKKYIEGDRRLISEPYN